MIRRSMKPRTDGRDLVAFLGALSLFLSTIEYLVPKPIPFLRVGIANLPLLIGLGVLSPAQLFLLAFLKVAGQGLVNGTLVSYVFLFSAAGTFTAAGIMTLAHRAARGRMSLVGVSVLGALGGNIAQVLLARVLIFGEGAWLIAAPFLAVGTVASALLGVFAERFSAKSRWLSSVRGKAGR